ncbi:hypothetical protein PH203_48775 [Streptomyces sp. S.PB5]|nr:hypothetical protein [Streptomyces sp. S.PB5]
MTLKPPNLGKNLIVDRRATSQDRPPKTTSLRPVTHPSTIVSQLRSVQFRDRCGLTFADAVPFRDAATWRCRDVASYRKNRKDLVSELWFAPFNARRALTAGQHELLNCLPHYRNRHLSIGRIISPVLDEEVGDLALKCRIADRVGIAVFIPDTYDSEISTPANSDSKLVIRESGQLWPRQAAQLSGIFELRARKQIIDHVVHIIRRPEDLPVFRVLVAIERLGAIVRH